MYEVYRIKDVSEEYLDLLGWSALWIPADCFEEAGIEDAYIAFDEDADLPIGFISGNGDGRVVAIEVHPAHQGKGVAFALIEKSGWFRPERNENPSFWAHVEEVFG